MDIGNPQRDEDPNQGVLTIRNRPHGLQTEFPAKEIVDAGFLELVRHGIRPAGDAVIKDSLKVIDNVLKVETPFAPCWHSYNHDGYGQREDGSAYEGTGVGRAWPLLTGERGHCELAAGHDPRVHITTLEAFADSTGLLAEQIWDQRDSPDGRMKFGRPTGEAMPLMWAHAEYIKLLRSTRDGRVFDLIPAVADRYLKRRNCRPLEVWKFSRQPRSVEAGMTLRVQAPAGFELRWTNDEWQEVHDSRSTPTELGIEFVDIDVSKEQSAPIRFTFYWLQEDRWEGQDSQVAVTQGG